MAATALIPVHRRQPVARADIIGTKVCVCVNRAVRQVIPRRPAQITSRRLVVHTVLAAIAAAVAQVKAAGAAIIGTAVFVPALLIPAKTTRPRRHHPTHLAATLLPLLTRRQVTVNLRR